MKKRKGYRFIVVDDMKWQYVLTGDKFVNRVKIISCLNESELETQVNTALTILAKNNTVIDIKFSVTTHGSNMLFNRFSAMIMYK